MLVACVYKHVSNMQCAVWYQTTKRITAVSWLTNKCTSAISAM